MSIKLIIHSALCILLLASAVMRLYKTDKNTFECVRVGFWILAVASAALLISPWAHKLWPWWGRLTVHPAQLGVLLGIVWVQIATARHWRDGVPERFQGSPPTLPAYDEDDFTDDVWHTQPPGAKP